MEITKSQKSFRHDCQLFRCRNEVTLWKLVENGGVAQQTMVTLPARSLLVNSQEALHTQYHASLWCYGRSLPVLRWKRRRLARFIIVIGSFSPNRCTFVAMEFNREIFGIIGIATMGILHPTNRNWWSSGTDGKGFRFRRRTGNCEPSTDLRPFCICVSYLVYE